MTTRENYEDDIDSDVIDMDTPRRRPRVLHRGSGPAPKKTFLRGGNKAALLRYAKYLPMGSSLLFGPLPGILQSYALQKMKPHFLARVRKVLISHYHMTARQADKALVEWADSIKVVKDSAINTAKEIARAETGEVGQTLLRDPSRNSMKKKSKKFERCVLAVKKSSRKKGAKRVNPWAVCHASLGKKARRDPVRGHFGIETRLNDPTYGGQGLPWAKLTWGSVDIQNKPRHEFVSHPSRESAETHIRGIRKMGPDWAAAEYRVVELKSKGGQSYSRDPSQWPKRVQILSASGAGYFKKGQYGYVLSSNRKGGSYWVDRAGMSSPGEIAYLVSKTKNMTGGALWFSESGIRFTKKSAKRDPKRSKKQHHSKAVMALAKKYAKARVKRSRS